MDLDRALLELLQGNAVKLPPYPATALKLSRVLRDPAHHRRQVVALVEADAPFTAAILKVANSAMWAGYGEVTTIPAAINRLGDAELGRLALTSGVAGALKGAGPLGPIGRQVWHDSVSSAVCAALMAPVLGLDRDELFVAGLLHDIGRMVAVHAIEDLLRQRPMEPARPAAEWARLVERYHVELGVLLARSWQLPELMIDCISQHHLVSPGGRFARQVRAVAAVDQLVDVLNGGVPLTSATLMLLSLEVPPEVQAVITAELAKAPSVIASFEDPFADDRGSKVTPAPVWLGGVAPLVPITVHLPNGASAACWSARATEVAFTSPRPMAEGFLQPIELSLPHQRFPVWLRVASSTPTPSGHDIVGQPFALTGAALDTWLAATHDGAAMARAG